MTWRWSVLGAALALPALAGWAGHGPWGWGLLLGEVLGAGAFFWISRSVRSALGPADGSKNPWGLLGHSLARLTVLGLIFFWVLKFSPLSIWAVLLGYLLVQLPATLWQRGALQGRKQGLHP